MSTYSQVSVWQFEKKKDLTYIELIRQGGWIEGGVVLPFFSDVRRFHSLACTCRKLHLFLTKFWEGVWMA